MTHKAERPVRREVFLTPMATFVATILFTLMLGMADWASGNDLYFFVFYFCPVAIAGWNCSPGRTYAIAILSTCVWFMANWFTGYHYAHVIYALWNTVILLAAFIVLGYSVLRIKDLLEGERQLSKDLQEALADVKTLTGLLPICSNCKKIRNDKGYWQQTEEYITKHTNALFTHSLCKECSAKLMKEAGLSPIDTEPSV
jgi:hypothetical protein